MNVIDMLTTYVPDDWMRVQRLEAELKELQRDFFKTPNALLMHQAFKENHIMGLAMDSARLNLKAAKELMGEHLANLALYYAEKEKKELNS